MSTESPKINKPESPEIRQEQYYQETLDTARKLSRRWAELHQRLKEEPNLLVGYPQLADIEASSKAPMTGVQKYFEGQVKFIKESSGNDMDARSRMMYRLKEDIDRMGEQVDDVLETKKK